MGKQSRRKRDRRDDVPKTLEEKVRWWTRAMVAMGRHFGHDDPRIHADVRRAIAKALEGGAIEFGPEVLDEGVMEPTCEPAGVFRMILNHEEIDRADQFVQERWHQVVMTELEATLARTDGDFRRRSSP